jgi:hypothetical protein
MDSDGTEKLDPFVSVPSPDIFHSLYACTDIVGRDKNTVNTAQSGPVKDRFCVIC